MNMIKRVSTKGKIHKHAFTSYPRGYNVVYRAYLQGGYP